MITASSLSNIQWAMVAFAIGFMASAFIGTKSMILSGLTALAGIAVPIWLLLNLTGSTLYTTGAAFIVGAILGHKLYERMAKQGRQRQEKEADTKRKQRY